MPNRLHLFQAYGVELEYMIVKKDSMDILPVSDKLIESFVGSISNDFNNGRITWSNELVLHVLELKSSSPDPDLSTLAHDFHKNVQLINSHLQGINAMLMPTAAHPWMNPVEETKLWPYDNNEIYELYNRMFDCKGHGWSNLQSTHINLPFYDDEEFSKLHTAVRVLLPILPAITASSPVLDSKFTGYLDKRLYYYQHNQKRFPSITGKVIPERIFSKRSYNKIIYDRILEDVRPFNEKGILEAEWVNSRGAIARFDRGSVEIRIIDIQESPAADMALVRLVVLVLKLLVYRKISSFDDQEILKTDDLHEIFLRSIRTGGDHVIKDRSFLNVWGVEEDMSITELWNRIFETVEKYYPEEYSHISFYIDHLQKNGSLSKRILKAIGDDYSRENLSGVYRNLSDCLQNNELFS